MPNRRTLALLSTVFALLSITSTAIADDQPVSILAAKIGGHIHPSICRTKLGG